MKQKKRELKARGIEVDESMPPSVISPSYNPKDTPESFVKKVIGNQKRMNKSIEIYEQKQKDGAGEEAADVIDDEALLKKRKLASE